MDDMVLPPALIRQDEVYKKCARFGKSLRYLSMGTKQLIISKDKEVRQIVNLIPIERGTMLLEQSAELSSGLFH